jgi:hypothetical protein
MIEAMIPRRNLVSLYSGFDMANDYFKDSLPPGVHYKHNFNPCKKRKKM